MNTSKANTNKPWLSDQHGMSLPENEEMWSQRVIDEYTKDLFNTIEQGENNVNEKTKD